MGPMSIEGLYRYLGTIAGLVEGQAQATKTNRQGNLLLIGVASLMI